MICMHKGISEQLKGRGIHEERVLIQEIRRRSKGFMLAVAGGIYPGTAKEVAAVGADVCVIGSAIYSSSDRKMSRARLLKEIERATPEPVPLRSDFPRWETHDFEHKSEA